MIFFVGFIIFIVLTAFLLQEGLEKIGVTKQNSYILAMLIIIVAFMSLIMLITKAPLDISGFIFVMLGIIGYLGKK